MPLRSKQGLGRSGEESTLFRFPHSTTSSTRRAVKRQAFAAGLQVQAGDECRSVFALPPAEFLQRIGYALRVAVEQIRQLHLLPRHLRAVPAHVQAQENVLLEGPVGEQGQSRSHLLAGGKPTGGLISRFSAGGAARRKGRQHVELKASQRGLKTEFRLISYISFRRERRQLL